MTEREWLVYTDPEPFRRSTHPMLVFLDSIGRTSERKLRLFAVACCRWLFSKVHIHPWYEHGVNAAERYADGAASVAELQGAFRCPPDDWLLQLSSEPGGNSQVAMSEWWQAPKTAVHACWNAAELEFGIVSADCAGGNAAWAATQQGTFMPDDNGVSEGRLAAAQAIHCDLIRCIFGNPFRPVVIDPGWQTSSVAALTQIVYADRAFDLLPFLADALEDAGCCNQDLLAHLRSPEPHVCGCWAVDLILGKQ